MLTLLEAIDRRRRVVNEECPRCGQRTLEKVRNKIFNHRAFTEWECGNCKGTTYFPVKYLRVA